MSSWGQSVVGRCRCGRTAELWLVGDRHRCGPCIETMLRKDEIDHITLQRDAGAPAAFLEQLEAKLEAGPLHRPGLPPHIWGAILARAIDERIAALAAAEPAQEVPDA